MGECPHGLVKGVSPSLKVSASTVKIPALSWFLLSLGLVKCTFLRVVDIASQFGMGGRYYVTPPAHVYVN